MTDAADVVSALASGPDLVERLSGDPKALDDLARELAGLQALAAGGGSPNRISVDPEQVEQGLARLVLSLIELVRRLMERQAIRRIEAGSLSDDEIERLGQTFMRLDEKMQELKVTFGLEDDDLNLNLGPLGNMM